MNRMIARAGAGAASLALMLAGGANVVAQSPAAPSPVVTPDGTVHVPAFDLPPSNLTSPEAVAAQKARAGMPKADVLNGAPIAEQRARIDQMNAPLLTRMTALYPVEIAEQRIGGVRTRIVTPPGGEADKARILINLHGGGFSLCAESCAILESVPVAALGRFRVVTVDYRQGPENVFPAASQDVATVYGELLKTYRPENIGIYGCSAGGMLTAEALAWFAAKGLPQPGAAGIFGAGGVPFGAGDSGYVSAYVEGIVPPPGPDGLNFPMPYFKGARMDDPLVSPARDLAVLAKFPPTLVVTGTRAMDLSPAVFTHGQLLKARARSSLIVAEGMGHCHIYQPDLPEARDTLMQIVKFFDANLGRKGRGGLPAPEDEPAVPQQQSSRERPERPKDCYVRTNALGPNTNLTYKVRKKNCTD